MLLERIEIDALGEKGPVQLGPFSHRLNAVYGPAVAGNCAIPQFVRDLLLGQTRRRYAASDQRHWDAGRLIWANTGGLLYCRREADGTANGRLTIDFEPRDQRFPASRDAYRRQLAHMPAAVVDWIITTANDTLLAPAILAIGEARLDTERLPSASFDRSGWERLQQKLREIDQRLADHCWPQESVEVLQRRQRFLQEELARWDRDSASLSRYERDKTQRYSLRQREADLQAESEKLRDQESELRGTLGELQREWRSLRDQADFHSPRVAIAEVHRRRLQDLDGQLMRWRETLREVRALREKLASPRRHWTPSQPLETVVSPESTPLQQLEARLESAHRQIDWLADRYSVDFDGSGAAPSKEKSQTPVSATEECDELQGHREFVGKLHGVKSELYRIYDSLAAPAAGDSDAAGEREVGQLKRCEIELLGSMELLIRHRQSMLRQIASEHQISTEQMTAAFGDWYQCQDHPHLYDWLLSSGTPMQAETRASRLARLERLEGRRKAAESELDRTVNRLENCLSELHSVRSEVAQLPKLSRPASDLQERRRTQAELDEIESWIDHLHDRERLIEERARCEAQIAALRPSPSSESAIHRRASCWLSRLSGGRLQRIDWNIEEVRGQLQEGISAPDATWSIRLDGRPLSMFSRADHQLATLAVRMAAGDEMARRGHGIPLLIETPSLFSAAAIDDGAPNWHGEAPGSGACRNAHDIDESAWLNAVIQYGDSGQQTIVLTADRHVMTRIERAGGAIHSLAARSQAPASTVYAFRSRPLAERSPRPLDGLYQANQDLDTAWRETYGPSDLPETSLFPRMDAHRSTDRSGNVRLAGESNANGQRSAGSLYEIDPGYSADRQMTRLYDDITTINRLASGNEGEATSPFFLTLDSPVEQAPSVDAVAAARLRSAGVTRVGQLLAADPRDLADVLGLADVTAAAIRRWQHEASLVCRVPQLRAFDARVLVGCGITDPCQLAAMHPGLLLEKVEAFLATDRGRRILRSGSSYELSRITSWIAAANRSVARTQRHGRRQATNGSLPTAADPHDALHEVSELPQGSHKETPARQHGNHQASDARRNKTSSSKKSARSDQADSRSWRFYLHRKSPVVDAPTIGPRTADKLERMGYATVHDLLQADADEIAEALNHRRIDGDRVRQWQEQATLVCRVPMLRGHDAQLLVAAGINEPERLAECDPEALLELIEPVAESSEGKRILRGATAPDLAEVTAWIEYAQHQRLLAAA